MRYVGQGHEIAVALPPRDLEEADVAAVRALYDEEYTRFYDRPVPGSDVEVMSFAVTVSTREEAVEPAARGAGRARALADAAPGGARHGDRRGGGVAGLRPRGDGAGRVGGGALHRGRGRDQHPGRAGVAVPGGRAGLSRTVPWRSVMRRPAAARHRPHLARAGPRGERADEYEAYNYEVGDQAADREGARRADLPRGPRGRVGVHDHLLLGERRGHGRLHRPRPDGDPPPAARRGVPHRVAGVGAGAAAAEEPWRDRRRGEA